MAIKLVQEDERLEFLYEGATLFYRRPSNSKQNFFIKKHTNKRSGNIDWVKVTTDVLNFCVLGWKGVLGGDGKEIEFETNLLGKLPTDFVADFMGEIGIANPEDVTEKKA